MAAVDPPETDPVRQLLRRRPPAAALGWAAAAIGPGSRVVAVRPLASAWLANHALDVADAGGAVHRVVLRRWARPGWDEEDPDFTAAREAAILELLAPTPVPAPALVAADPDGAACDVPRLNLAWDLGLEAADRFLAAHHALTGLDHHPHWDVVAAVDTVPELESPGPPPEPWLRRMEELVAAALARLGG
jgi:hypothetical protein